MIKIIAILALIVMGVIMVAVHFRSPEGIQANLSNLWSHPGPSGSGFFPNGFQGFLGGFQLAIFSFLGIELVGTTAAEATEPEVVLPKAINSIPVRILLFYILALGAIMSVTPWNQVDPDMSPFVNLFSLVGLVAAASVVNFVVISSAASSCNSGVYSTSRMLYSLANQGHAPAWTRSLSKRLVPRNSLLVSCVLLLTSIPLMMLGGSIMDAFTLITSVSSVLFLFIWVMIVSGYVAFRRRRPEAFAASTFRLPGGYFSVGIIYLFIAAMLVVLALDKSTFHAMIASALWLGALGLVGYLRFQRH